MKAKEKSIKDKLLVRLLPTVALVCALGAGAVFAIHQIDADTARTYEKSFKGMAALTRASRALTAMRGQVKLRLDLGGAQNLSKLAAALPGDRAQIDKAWRDYYPARTATAAEKKQASAAYARYQKLRPALDAFTAMVKDNDLPKASRFYSAKLQKGLNRFANSLDQLRDSHSASADKVFLRGHNAARGWQWAIIFVAGLFVALAVLIALMIARTLTRPLAKARAFADAIACGWLDNDIEHDACDEFGEMITSLALVQQQLAGSVAAAEQTQAALCATDTELEAANARLAQTEALYRELFVRNPLPLYVVDRDTLRFLEVNDTAQSHYGFDHSEFMGMTLRDIEPATAIAAADRRRSGLDPARTNAGLWQHVTRAGATRDVELSMYAVQWAGRGAWLIAARDVTAQRAARQTLELRNQAIEASHNGIFICSAAAAAGSVCYVNAAMAQFSGQSRDALIGAPLADLFPQNAADDTARLLEALAAGRRGQAVIAVRPEGKDTLWLEAQVTRVPDAADAADAAGYWIGVVQDITERKTFEAALAYRADHDDLTGLPNRNALRRNLAEAVAAAGSAGHEVAVLFLDLDGFKQINDSGGHQAGDIYLQTVAERLNSRIRAGDTLARVGGDEFVLVTAGPRLTETLSRRARRLQEAFADPVTVAEQTFQARCSIGIACYPRHGEDAETLLRRADLTMYTAKRSGEQTIEWFAPAVEARFRQRSLIEAALGQALADDAFELHYQPQVDMRAGVVAGLEALLRWPGADATYRCPADFIPIAEETGQIVPVGAWVLKQACTDLARLRTAGYTTLTMAVNVSAAELRDGAFAERVAAALAAHALPAEALEIELTESVFAAELASSTAALRALETLGVRLAIDDFGTGDCSLSRLSRLPVRRLKIDRSFVGQMNESPRINELVRTIARMAANLELEALAEGVETAAERDILLGHDCVLAQGFYYSRGLPMADLVKYLDKTAALAVAI